MVGLSRPTPRTRPNLSLINKFIPLLLLFCGVCLIGIIYLMQGADPMTPSSYKTYTLQALQWRKGLIALDHDYPHLELAIYNGQYFVSFPPVPAVIVYLLTFIFGDAVPDALLMNLYALGACLVIYYTLKRHVRYPAVWAFLLCFASSLLPLLQNGAVWYQAQALCFSLTASAVLCIQKNKPTLSLFLYALSVGCRPFNALYGPILMFYYVFSGNYSSYTQKRAAIRLIPGIALGLCVAAVYAWYNTIRFGNPLEFGHNYLPEFSTQGNKQFALSYLIANLKTFVWGLPLTQTASGLQFKRFGFSLFIANPILLLLVYWFVRDAFTRQTNVFKVFVMTTFLLHTALLLSHHTCGGFQYGARYFIDCIPYALLYMVPFKKNTDSLYIQTRLKARVPEGLILSLGLGLAIGGSFFIHI